MCRSSSVLTKTGKCGRVRSNSAMGKYIKSTVCWMSAGRLVKLLAGLVIGIRYEYMGRKPIFGSRDLGGLWQQFQQIKHEGGGHLWPPLSFDKIFCHWPGEIRRILHVCLMSGNLIHHYMETMLFHDALCQTACTKAHTLSRKLYRSVGQCASCAPATQMPHSGSLSIRGLE